jgi:hypothetical protein
MKQNIHHESFDTAEELKEFITQKITRSQVQNIQFAGGKWVVWFWKV